MHRCNLKEKNAGTKLIGSVCAKSCLVFYKKIISGGGIDYIDRELIP